MKTVKTLTGSYKAYIKILYAVLLLFIVNSGFSQGRVLINEYLAWPANSCSVTSEYIELYNFGPGPANIGCYILTDGDYSITFPPNTIIQPGQYFVIAGQSTLPLGCANANATVTVDLNWNTCNCTSAPIPTSGDGLMTDGGGGSEQLVLLDPSLKVVDAIVRNLSETYSPINSSSMSGQCTALSFDLDTMNIQYEMVGESQGRANSFARRIDGGCGWLKDPQQSGGASNNTPGANSELDASLAVTTALTCTNTGAVSVSVNSGNYSQIFPMKYLLAKDIDSNHVYDFTDSYVFGTNSTSNTIAVNNLGPGVYKLVVETKSGCDLTEFNFNILGCNSGVLNIAFTSFELVNTGNNMIRLVWDVGQRERVKSFIVQGSADGINYTNYAIISDPQDQAYASSYFFEHAIPAGLGFYRIQVITKDGQTGFSPPKTTPATNASMQTSVYPNPFTQQFLVSVHSTREENCKLLLLDVFGRIVRNDPVKIHAGNNKIFVNTIELQPGLYTIRLQSTSSQTIATSRVLKISR